MRKFKSLITAYTASALASAQNVSNYASSLMATQTFGAINGAMTIVGSAGLNVISVSSIQNAALTLTGGANDIFVINLSGNLQTNQAMVLSGGLTADHILWNLTGASGNIFVTSGGNVVYGTFLATRGGDYQFSNLDLTGELINTAGTMQIVSGSTVNGDGFRIPQQTVPDTGSSLLLMSIGLGVVGLAGQKLLKPATVRG